MDIAREPVVIELLEARSAHSKAAGKPAEFAIPLQHCGANTAFAEFISRGQSAKTTADHRDMGAKIVVH